MPKDIAKEDKYLMFQTEKKDQNQFQITKELISWVAIKIQDGDMLRTVKITDGKRCFDVFVEW